MTERLWTIRFAHPSDIDALGAIEVAAAQIFQSLDEFSGLAQSQPTAPERQQQLIGSRTVFVATDMKNQPIGFLTAEAIDDRLHIFELSVLPEWQRMGIGRALINVAREAAVNLHLRALTLTTFRNVPWNAPFYAELGFEEAHDKALQHHLNADADNGLPYKDRCAMAMVL
jgi:GNAT superfamily N-acetyltransferase